MNLSSLPIQGIEVGQSLGTQVRTGGQDSNFVDTLKDAISQANSLQTDADNKVVQLANGGQDVHSAMIAVEEANLSFQMMMQVRNKVLQAYQQVSGMQF